MAQSTATMIASTALRDDLAAARRRGSIPAWTILVFVVAIVVAYSPGVLTVFSILADFDALALKGQHFFFHNEAVHLASIARPVAALLSNLPVVPVQSPQDFRWVHLFAILTVCVLGRQMIAISIRRLQISAWDAVAIALATFLGLALIYAVLESTAWVPHLFTPFLAFWAYSVLGRSNVLALSFLGHMARRDDRALAGQLLAYCRARPVWMACLIYQVAFYTYPPYALLVVVFPVIAVLYSQAPVAYRSLIAIRDVLFIGVNVVLYSLSAALIYLPIVRIFTAKGSGVASAYESEYVANLYAGHQFAYNTDVSVIVQRLGHILTISGDLWLLPQTHMHIVTAIVLVLGLAARWAMAAAHPRVRPLALGGYGGVIATLVWVACFVMAASPILMSAGGFVGYRTNVATTAVLAATFIFAMRSIVEALWSAIGKPPSAMARAGDVTVALVVGVAFAANAYANYAVMKLGRNEYAYFTGIVRRAIADKTKAIVLIDPRPWHGAQDYNLWPIVDEQGRAVPPLELGCFASFCRQTGGIVRVIAADLGLSDKSFELVLARGDEPVSGLTCEMLQGATPSYPANASKRAVEIVDRYRSLAPLTCEQVSMAWHDLGLDLQR
jgi:hypothetical protein